MSNCPTCGHPPERDGQQQCACASRVDLETDLPPVEHDPILAAELADIQKYGGYSRRRMIAACKVADAEISYAAVKRDTHEALKCLEAIDRATKAYAAVVAAEEKENHETH